MSRNQLNVRASDELAKLIDKKRVQLSAQLGVVMALLRQVREHQAARLRFAGAFRPSESISLSFTPR